MPHHDPAAHDAAHLVTEFLAAIVLIAAGLVILGLYARRRSRGRTSDVVIARPSDPVASVRAMLLLIATWTAVAGIAIALAPILRAEPTAAAGVARAGPDILAMLGVLFCGIALGLLGVARFSVPRLGDVPLLRLRTGLSVAAVPAIGVAFLAVVVALSASGAPGAPGAPGVPGQ